MPNWCDNRASFTHKDKEKIDLIERELMKKDNCQLFNALIPRPADQEENWYEWNCDNWGCKWDATIIDWQRDDDNTLTVYMETAWAPPLKFYYSLLEEYYHIDAVYYEPGMGYCGWFDNGNDNYYEYDLGDKESIEALPEEILEFTNLLEEHENFIAEEREVYEYNLDGEEDEKSNS
jgi:hypothetical protein